MMLGLIGGEQRRLRVYDSFNRADSSTTLGSAETGQAWVVGQGTWGVSGGRAYCVSAVASNLVTIEIGTPNHLVRSILYGIINSGTDYSAPMLVFRYKDLDNYLMVILEGGYITLYKRDAAVNTSLAAVATPTSDYTDYLVEMLCLGNEIIVSVDGMNKINYTLTGENTKYAAYTKVGFRLSKLGAPASNAARWDNFRVEVA